MNIKYQETVFPLLARLLVVDQIVSLDEALLLMDRRIAETRQIALELLEGLEPHVGFYNIYEGQHLPTAINHLAEDVERLKSTLEKDHTRVFLNSEEERYSEITDKVVRKEVETFNQLFRKIDGISYHLKDCGWEPKTVALKQT